jgi:hypothetical protein
MQKTETISVLPINGTLADLQNYIEHLEAENAIMRKLSTRKGFYSRYFSNLKISETAIEAFNLVNKEYHSLFGNHRFTDYESFKRIVALNGN